MKKIAKLSIEMITPCLLAAYGGLSNSEEIVLCLSSTDQHVVTVNEVEDCLEDEKHMKMRGSGIADLKSLPPVAIFDDSENCDTEGTVTKIGFDKNSNYKLDEDEITLIKETCALTKE